MLLVMAYFAPEWKPGAGTAIFTADENYSASNIKIKELYCLFFLILRRAGVGWRTEGTFVFGHTSVDFSHESHA
jgi:hypothetical protein